MVVVNLTGDMLVFIGDVKRNVKCVKGRKVFVFKNEICGIIFKCFFLGVNINVG